MDNDQSFSTTGRDARVVVDLALDDPAWLDDLPGAEGYARQACVAAFDHACPETRVGVSLMLADDACVRGLNSQWLAINKPTNVLSFPSADRIAGAVPEPEAGRPPGEEIALGDIVLARETLLREAQEAALPANHHLAHLVVHGALHLLGYDHNNDDEAETMEAVERLVLAGLGVPDPYA